MCKQRKDIHKIMKELVDDGSTVLMVSSDDAELADIAKLIDKTKVMIMYAGQVVKVLQGEDITIQNIIHYSIFGKRNKLNENKENFKYICLTFNCFVYCFL